MAKESLVLAKLPRYEFLTYSACLVSLIIYGLICLVKESSGIQNVLLSCENMNENYFIYVYKR